MRRLWSGISGLAVRSWRLLLTALVSMTAGYWTWIFADGLRPEWTVRPQASHVSPIGFTDADLLVTCEAKEGVRSSLVIRHAANGEVTDRFDLGRMVVQTGALSEDQEWIVLTAGMPREPGRAFSMKTVVVSRTTGKLRGPPIPMSTSRVLSPKGRFLVGGRNGGGNPLSANFVQGRRIVDVTTGAEIPLAPKVQVRFSPDEVRCITFGGTGQDPIVFHALPEGAVIARTALSSPEDGELQLVAWREDRIEIARAKDIMKTPNRYPTISYRVDGTDLVDPQRGEHVTERPTGVYTDLRDERSVFWWPIRAWNRFFPKSRIRFQRMAWQQMDRVTGQNVGDKIDVEDARHGIVSKSGRWFATGGDRLCVWSLPARQNSWRGVAALLAAAAPWAWRIWRTRRRPVAA